MTLIGKHILIVDDESDIRDILRDAFTLEDAVVYSAPNGQEALDILGKVSIDFVVSDIRMPILDGIGLLIKIRANNAALPHVALITGFSEQSDAAAIGLGAAQVFHKPIDVGALIDLASSLL